MLSRSMFFCKMSGSCDTFSTTSDFVRTLVRILPAPPPADITYDMITQLLLLHPVKNSNSRCRLMVGRYAPPPADPKRCHRLPRSARLWRSLAPHLYVYVYVLIYVYVYVMYVYTQMYVYIYIYIYIERERERCVYPPAEDR